MSLAAGIEQVGGNSPSGVQVGGTTGSKIGLYAATPVVQAAAITTVVSSGAATTDINAIGVAVDAIITALKNIGVTL